MQLYHDNHVLMKFLLQDLLLIDSSGTNISFFYGFPSYQNFYVSRWDIKWELMMQRVKSKTKCHTVTFWRYPNKLRAGYEKEMLLTIAASTCLKNVQVQLRSSVMKLNVKTKVFEYTKIPWISNNLIFYWSKVYTFNVLLTNIQQYFYPIAEKNSMVIP